MYFIFEMEFNTNKTYMTKLIRAFAEKFDIEPDVMQGDEKITLIFRQGDPQIEHFLTELNDLLPASIFFGKSHYYTADKKPQPERVNEVPLPCNLSLCPSCQKEMFDVSSSRYYYPFTSCNNCGGQYPFVTQYPYKRENSTMKFMIPCAACENERSTNPLRKGYALISCVECGIPLRMNDGKSVRYANDKGSYRKLFEVSAAALAKGKSVLIKTVNGYRKFFQPTQEMSLQHTTLMVTEAPALNRHMMMITQEFNALLSIERPLVRVATKSDEMKALYGTTVLVKYPDDGMSMLLARELLNIGLEYVAYEVAEESTPADFLVDFDLPVEPQRDATLFINQDDKFFISGERIIFPSTVDGAKDVVSIAHNLATVTVDDTLISDSRDRFHDVKTSRINVLESEPFESSHSQVHRFRQWEASMLSVLADHHALNEKAIGV
ncbi:MAG TPA: hypothetical protein ENK72_02085, partial [Epsilonproteobacteria bacterium]|nr:hypothetical protein [Campylobacterota bacterium]